LTPTAREWSAGLHFGESDGTQHEVGLLEGNGRMILRVTLSGTEKTVDLLFTNEQAVAFTEGAEAYCADFACVSDTVGTLHLDDTTRG
jgi:hypothetical protein